MRYLGGKSRTARQIAGYLNLMRKPNQVYWEPFCGACWITERITAQVRYASDKNDKLIALWQALQAGWIPPDTVSEDKYAATKQGVHADKPHLEAFILLGGAYGGKWADVYARDHQGRRNFIKQAQHGLLRKLKHLRDVHFSSADFFDSEPPAPNCQVYCDPPYEGTTGYDYTGKFDNTAFWERCSALQALGHDVFVSEYVAPEAFSCVLEVPTRTDLRTKTGRALRIERVFSADAALLPLQPMLF